MGVKLCQPGGGIYQLNNSLSTQKLLNIIGIIGENGIIDTNLFSDLKEVK